MYSMLTVQRRIWEENAKYESKQESELDEIREGVQNIVERFAKVMQNVKWMNCVFRTG